MRRIESAPWPGDDFLLYLLGSRELSGDNLSCPLFSLVLRLYLNRLRIMSRISPAHRPSGEKRCKGTTTFPNRPNFSATFLQKKFHMGPTPILYRRIENYDRAVPW